MAAILVVEDDLAIAQMIKLILGKHGHDLRHVMNGEEALETLTTWRPDLIISDVMMPGLDGFALIKYLKGQPELADIPIIFVTALSQVEQISHGLNMGAVDYLPKPFRAMELEARVNNALRLKFLQDDLRRANTELTELTLVDSLTGLKNHRYVSEYLEQNLLHSQRYGEPLSLLMVDIDHFKKVNDTYGHVPAGNDVLQELAKVLRAQTRQSDVVCRFGGEEFLIICANTPRSAANTLGERIRHAVNKHAFPHLIDETLTVSVGVATFEPKRDRDASALLSRVDSALYLAKNEGRNKVCVAP
ncbi:MAG TPA: diguanylate cyclase [Anaerolineae bacterium]